MSRANGDGGGLQTYSRILLHLRGKTSGAADAVKDSNTGNSSNIANRDKISTDATVSLTNNSDSCPVRADGQRHSGA